MRTRSYSGSTLTRYTYASGLLVSQTDGTNTLSFVYSANGEALGFTYNGTIYFYLRSVQGDIIGICDSTGAVVVDYVYDSWGKPISVTGSLASTIGAINPLRYRGYYYDSGTGFYYLQSRYYDPETGRFLNADGIMGINPDMATYNLFAYCGNNPVNRCDSSGNSWWSTLKSKVSNAWNSIKTNISKAWNKEKASDQDISFAYGGVGTSDSGTIKNGWTYRIDKANPKTNTKRHIHIEKNSNKYSQNEDGSSHDGSTGTPPKKVLKILKEKEIWDWEDNRIGNSEYSMPINESFYAMPGFYCVPIADMGVAIIPAFPSVYFSSPSLCPATVIL